MPPSASDRPPRKTKKKQAPRPDALPDLSRLDVKAACERIYELAKELHWGTGKLGEEAGHSFQAINNWKKGHHLPKIGYLQDAAAAVGGRIRVLFEVADRTGATVVREPDIGGAPAMTRTPEDEEVERVARILADISEPGIRRTAAQAAALAALAAKADEYRKLAANPRPPTATKPPPRGRRKMNPGPTGT